MPNPQALDSLRDIHMPSPISWWPLAPGWYFLLIFGITAVVFSLRFVSKVYKYALPKKEALKLLADYQHQYLSKSVASNLIIAKISELLKRTALAYYPRKEVAQLSGQAWLAFLTATSKNLDFSESYEDLCLAQYQDKSCEHNLKPLFDLAKAWISQRGRKCLP